MFLDLQTQPLDGAVPSVIGTYFLAGRRRSNPKALEVDLGYVGQSCALKTGQSAGRGVKSRMFQHRKNIEQAKSGKTRKKRCMEIVPNQDSENQPASKTSSRLWASQRLAHEDIENVSYALLSIFPVTRKHPRGFDQMRLILSLAETIDVVFLGTLGPQCSVRFAGEFGLQSDLQTCPNLRTKVSIAPSPSPR